VEVILLKEVNNLGNPGDIIKVKNGYARNFLLPQKIAVEKTAHSLKVLEKQREEFEKLIAAQKEKYDAILAKFTENSEIEVKVKTGQDGKLFGTVTSAQIADGLNEILGLDIEKKQVIIREHIRHLGTYPVSINLGKDHKTEINVTVVSEE
jgi:large subunit ribosomal protein L9